MFLLCALFMKFRSFRRLPNMAPIIPSTALFDEDESACAVCCEHIGSVRADGSMEVRYKLPCSHMFGNLCILQWLQMSPQQDCPICRRRMVHIGCGHLIMPHDASTAPPTISEEKMPKQCIRCRGEDILATILQAEHERLQAAEAALRGMQRSLPKFLSFASTVSLYSVDSRIDELRQNFAVFHERAWREFEEQERQVRW